MNTFLLLLLMICLLVFGYFMTGKQLASPIVLFTFPFILAILDGFVYYTQWQYNLSSLALSIALWGTICFVGAAVASHFVFSDFYKKHLTIRKGKTKKAGEELRPLILPNWFYVVLSIVCVINFLIILHAEKALDASYGYPVSSFSDIVGSYNQLTKFGNLNVSLDGVAAYLYEVNFGSALVLSYLLARNLIAHVRGTKAYVVLAYVVSTVTLLSCGSRSVALTSLFSFTVIYIILKQKYAGVTSISGMKVRSFGRILLAFVLFAVVFLFSLDFIGRGDSTDNWSSPSKVFYAFSIYLGAPLKNFDLAVAAGRQPTTCFGENTFNHLYQTLDKFHITQGCVNTESAQSTFEILGQWFLGNVYTVFDNMYNDFGFIGTLVLLALYGFFLQWVFEYVVARPERDSIPFFMIYYGYMGYQIIFSFFADMISETISMVMVKKMIITGIWCFGYYLYGRYVKNKAKMPGDTLRTIDEITKSSLQ